MIIAGNTALNGQDVGSAAACSLDPLVVSGTSLIGENEAGYWAEAFPDGSLVGTPDTPLNADLLPLGDYGGPTRTMLPLVGSPAVDNATGGTSLLTEDQRHEVRPLGSFRDLGAVEGTVSKIDSDGDGFADVDENCPTISNPDQSENPCLPLTNSADDGSVGSLRDIISRALPGHVITFDPALMSGGTITLNGTPLQIEKALTIDASNLPGGLTLSGNDVSRIFSIYSSIYGDVVVELRGLTITGGADNQGGCIYNSGGTGESLSIFDSTITGCIAKRGGGIYSTGALAIVNSTISGNRVNNTISFGPYDGGGILATGPLTLVHSTVTDNHAGPIIGASSSRGGGIRASGLTTIENSIIAGNTAATEGDDLWLSGTIIASGANLIGDNSGAEATFPAGPLVGTKASPLNPVLAPLGNYGGSSQTMVPLPGSPAISTLAEFWRICAMRSRSWWVSGLRPIGSTIERSEWVTSRAARC